MPRLPGGISVDWMWRTAKHDAFSSLVNAFRAQGPQTQYISIILEHVKQALNINDEMTRAEIRRAANDELLSKIAHTLNPSYDSVSSWCSEGLESDIGDVAFCRLPPARPFYKKTSHEVSREVLSFIEKFNDRIDSQRNRYCELMELPPVPYVPERLRVTLRSTARIAKEREQLHLQSIPAKVETKNEVVPEVPPVSQEAPCPPEEPSVAESATERILPIVKRKRKFKSEMSGAQDSRLPPTLPPTLQPTLEAEKQQPLIGTEDSAGPSDGKNILQEALPPSSLKSKQSEGVVDQSTTNSRENRTIEDGEVARKRRKLSKEERTHNSSCARVRMFRFEAAEPGKLKPIRGEPGRSSRERPHSRRDKERSHSRRDGVRSHSRRDGVRSHSRRDGERSHSRRDGERSHSRRDGERSHSRRDGERSHSRREGEMSNSRIDAESSHSKNDLERPHPRMELKRPYVKTEGETALVKNDLDRSTIRTTLDTVPPQRVLVSQHPSSAFPPNPLPHPISHHPSTSHASLPTPAPQYNLPHHAASFTSPSHHPLPYHQPQAFPSQQPTVPLPSHQLIPRSSHHPQVSLASVPAPLLCSSHYPASSVTAPQVSLHPTASLLPFTTSALSSQSAPRQFVQHQLNQSATRNRERDYVEEHAGATTVAAVAGTEGPLIGSHRSSEKAAASHQLTASTLQLAAPTFQLTAPSYRRVASPVLAKRLPHSMNHSESGVFNKTASKLFVGGVKAVGAGGFVGRSPSRLYEAYSEASSRCAPSTSHHSGAFQEYVNHRNNGTPTDFLATAGDEHDYSKPMHSTVLSPSLHMMSEINPAVTTVAQVVGARSSLRGRSVGSRSARGSRPNGTPRQNTVARVIQVQEEASEEVVAATVKNIMNDARQLEMANGSLPSVTREVPQDNGTSTSPMLEGCNLLTAAGNHIPRKPRVSPPIPLPNFIETPDTSAFPLTKNDSKRREDEEREDLGGLEMSRLSMDTSTTLSPLEMSRLSMDTSTTLSQGPITDILQQSCMEIN